MQYKKCRNCKQPKLTTEFTYMPIGKYWVSSTCKECTLNKQKPKPISKISKTNSNTPAKFTQRVKDEILARDEVCVISGEPITDYHHVYYWPIQANYWPDRNNADQWVWLSANVHRIIHHASPGEVHLSRVYRAKCIAIVESYNT